MSLLICVSSPIPAGYHNPAIKETLKGGAELYNHTKGIVTVSYDEEGSKKAGYSHYNLLANGKIINDIVVDCRCPHIHPFGLMKSRSIALMPINEGRYIHIVETDTANIGYEGYIDVTDLFKETAYRCFQYRPGPVGKEWSEKKIAVLKQENPELSILVSGHNRHGVVAFGINHKATQVNNHVCMRPYVLFCANPCDEKMKLIWGDCVANSALGDMDKAYINDQHSCKFQYSLPEGSEQALIELNSDSAAVLEANSLKVCLKLDDAGSEAAAAVADVAAVEADALHDQSVAKLEAKGEG